MEIKKNKKRSKVKKNQNFVTKMINLPKFKLCLGKNPKFFLLIF